MAGTRVFCVMILIALYAATTAEPERFIATECYGSILSMSCKRGHRIKVVEDFFGLSAARDGPPSCQYMPGDCTINNNRYSSVIHRYCEGLESCTRFQVDRRNCGANLTSYEQVEYECVPDADVINVCSRVNLKSPEGYISTPNFPNEYLPNSHCRCSLRTEKEGAFVKLTFTQFIIKYDNPCRDYVEVVLDGESRRLCGAYRSTLSAGSIDLVFHSDAIQGHQGFWLHFTAEPADREDVQVVCGPERYITTTTTTTTATTPRHASNQHEYIQDIVEWNKIEDRLLGREVTTVKILSKKLAPFWKENDGMDHEADAIIAPSQVAPRITTESPQQDKHDTDFSQLDRVRRDSSKTTGIIIISICVGGILLLIIILSVLLCLNKRKTPQRKTLCERKDKLQQQLSSLSFYDSIPLYDSIGHKGGVARAPPVVSHRGGVARAPPVGGDRNGNGKASDSSQCLSGSKCMPWKSDGPYWTNLHADLVDSDHDSAVYAEIDRQSREVLSELGSPATLRGDSPVTYSVSLDTHGEVSQNYISTHV